MTLPHFCKCVPSCLAPFPSPFPQHFSLTSLFNSKMVTTRQSTPPAEPQPPLRVAPMPQQPPQPPPPRPAPPPMTSGELEGGSGSHSGLSPDWDHDTQTLVLKVCALPGWWVEEQWEHCPGVGWGDSALSVVLNACA